jgi:hypothetical protein
MNKDVWKTPEQACAMLGEGWGISPNGQWIVLRNESGVIVSQRRIFSGTEHPKAQAGMVVFQAGETMK